MYYVSKEYAPIRHLPGEAQVDLGCCSFIEKGNKYKGYYLVMSVPYSNIAFCQMIKGKNAQAIIQSMKNIFEFIGGVPHEITFDNEGGLVKCLGEKITKRIENELFLRYYYLEPKYAKQTVQVKLTHNKVLFYDMDNNKIAEFDRLYGDKTFTAIHWEKWLPTISRRPNSLFHSSLTDNLHNGCGIFC